MKSAEEIRNILEAYDLTRSFRDASELADCSHHTVARYVRARDEGRLGPGVAAPRPRLIDGYLEKIEELVDDSDGKMRADVVHEKITALGFTGSERTTRRAVVTARAAWHAGRRRSHRPWIAEPGAWAHYDFGDGPVIDGRTTLLFCLWLSWCRFRVVIPLRDKDPRSIWTACDTAFRQLGGVPVYLLTGTDQAGGAGAAEFGRYYGLTAARCTPYVPAATAGTVPAIKLAQADLVPTEADLPGEYRNLTELEAACAAFCVMVNAREHRITGRAPVDMLIDERVRLRPVPAVPLNTALGVGRREDTRSAPVFEDGRPPVRHEPTGRIPVSRRPGEHVVARVTADGPAQQRETGPGEARAQDAPGLDVLTARELEVLRLVARGHSNHGIGHELHISTSTVSIHVSHILAKLRATNRTEAAGRLRYRELISADLA